MLYSLVVFSYIEQCLSSVAGPSILFFVSLRSSQTQMLSPINAFTTEQHEASGASDALCLL
jgi:hypothetical protein